MIFAVPRTRAGSLVRRRTAGGRAGSARLRHLVRAGRGERTASSASGRRSCGSRPARRSRPSRAAHADRDRLLLLAAVGGRRATRPAAQQAGLRAGMALGVMHDLAVGVTPPGPTPGLCRTRFAAGITVGAPPDPYNQNGQDWSQPPWRPDRLAETAYAPFREMVSSMLRHAGGIRVDHVIGLFRLWWIPEGAGPKEGTYVRYDHEAMVGILALEAQRAGALVVGEDLGTVEPWVRSYLRERGILGTSILWFEFDFDGDGAPLSPERWREYCLASVTTHDLPPTAGYLAGDHVRLRDGLGVLTRSLTEELAVDAAERQAWLDKLRALGGAARRTPSEEETVQALHRYLTWTPSPAALRRADRCRRRSADAEPAGHDRRVPELAGAAQRPGRSADAAGGGLQPRAGGGTGRGGRSARSGLASAGAHRRWMTPFSTAFVHGVGLGLGQRAGLDRGVQPGPSARRPVGLPGGPDLGQRGPSPWPRRCRASRPAPSPRQRRARSSGAVLRVGPGGRLVRPRGWPAAPR